MSIVQQTGNNSKMVFFFFFTFPFLLTSIPDKMRSTKLSARSIRPLLSVFFPKFRLLFHKSQWTEGLSLLGSHINKSKTSITSTIQIVTNSRNQDSCSKCKPDHQRYEIIGGLSKPFL